MKGPSSRGQRSGPQLGFSRWDPSGVAPPGRALQVVPKTFCVQVSKSARERSVKNSGGKKRLGVDTPGGGYGRPRRLTQASRSES